MTTYDSRSFYTRGDSFSVGASREHIERALLDFGATDVLFSQREHLNAISFRACGRQFRIVFSLPQADVQGILPGKAAEGFGGEEEAKAFERSTRKFWRAFALATDAKLAAAAGGVATLESEFLAHVVLPGNHTVIEELEPVIASAYQSGRRPSISDSGRVRG